MAGIETVLSIVGLVFLIVVIGAALLDRRRK
jgi:hypothetical protein